MVRPAARYRPAAKRSVVTTDPLWIVTNPWDFNANAPNDALTRSIALVRGSQGQVLEYQPWQVATPPTVTSGDGGLLAALVSRYSSDPSYRVDGSEWTGQVRRQCLPMVLEVIDGIAYIVILRGVFCSGNARVGWSLLNPAGGVLSTGIETSALVASAASYDILYSSVNLQTGIAVHASAPLYQYTLNVSSALGGQGAIRNYVWSVSLNYGGLKEILTNLMPESHPFNACSASDLYGYFASSWLQVGDNSFTSASVGIAGGGAPTPLVTTNNFANSFQPPAFFYDLCSGPFFNKTLSLSTQNDQHVVLTVQNGVLLYELATLDAVGPTPSTLAYRQCSNYRYLGLPGPTSFSSYDSQLVEPADTQLDWSGLSAEDQTKVRVGVPGPMPAALSVTRYSLSTADPTIFSTYTPPLSFEVGKTSYLLFII